MLKKFIPNFHGKVDEVRKLAPSGFTLIYKPKVLWMQVSSIFEFPKEWKETYDQNAYWLGDPVVVWGSSKQGAARWSELEIPDVRGVLKEACNYGLNYGLVFSKKEEARRFIMTTARSDREFNDREMTRLQTLFTEMADAVLSYEDLSERETATLKLLSAGLRNQAISEQLNITVATVKSRVEKIKSKLNAATIGEAAAMGVFLGIIEGDE